MMEVGIALVSFNSGELLSP